MGEKLHKRASLASSEVLNRYKGMALASSCTLVPESKLARLFLPKSWGANFTENNVAGVHDCKFEENGDAGLRANEAGNRPRPVEVHWANSVPAEEENTVGLRLVYNFARNTGHVHVFRSGTELFWEVTWAAWLIISRTVSFYVSDDSRGRLNERGVEMSSTESGLQQVGRR